MPETKRPEAGSPPPSSGPCRAAHPGTSRPGPSPRLRPREHTACSGGWTWGWRAVLGGDQPGPGGGGGRSAGPPRSRQRGQLAPPPQPEAQLLRDPGSGRARDPAETPRPAGDAACRSQSRASGVCVIARPANGRGPGCRFLLTGSPAPGERRLARPASEAQSSRLRTPGAGPGECSGGQEVGRAPPPLWTGWGGGSSSSVCPTRSEVGRGCASALSCTPGGAPPPDPHPDP